MTVCKVPISRAHNREAREPEWDFMEPLPTIVASEHPVQYIEMDQCDAVDGRVVSGACDLSGFMHSCLCNCGYVS